MDTSLLNQYYDTSIIGSLYLAMYGTRSERVISQHAWCEMYTFTTTHPKEKIDAIMRNSKTRCLQDGYTQHLRYLLKCA